MKKLSALLLAIAMLLSVSIIPANAMDVARVDEDDVAAVVEEYIGTVLGLSEDATITVDDELISDIVLEGKGEIAKTAEAVADIALVKASDPAVQALLDDTAYSVFVDDNGKLELYYGISIADHPELYKINTFRKYVKALVDNADTYFEACGYDPQTENVQYDNYNRLAGELVCHMIVYDVLSPVSGALTDTFKSYLTRSAYADLSYNDTTAPSWFYSFVGTFFMKVAKMISIYR